MLNEEVQLNEYTELNGSNCQIITEEAEPGKKCYKIKGCFSKAGVKNKNGRVYPKEIMAEAVKEVQPLIQQGKFVAECEHPTSAKINLERIAAKVNSLEMMEDGTVVGEMKILDTEAGRTIKHLVDEGVFVGVSTRGSGQVKKTKIDLGEGVMEEVDLVQPGFKLVAIDLVGNPSAGEFGSPQFFTEGQQFGKSEKKNTLKNVWTNCFK